MNSPTWADLSDDDLTTELIQELLVHIDDDLWVATACLDRVLDDVELQRELLKLGIQRTNEAIRRAKAALEEENSEEGDDFDARDVQRLYFRDHPEDAQLCAIRAALLDRNARLERYVQVAEYMEDVELEDTASVDEGWEDDPWADEFDTGSIRTAKSRRSKSQMPVPLPLSTFLTQHPVVLCLALVSQLQFSAAKKLMEICPGLFECRFAILENIALFAEPSLYRDLLPAVDPATGEEQRLCVDPSEESRCEQRDGLASSILAPLKESVSWLGEELYQMPPPPNITIQEHVLSGEEISSWYKDRVNGILRETGMVDIALSLVQHGISLGVSSLDEVGEDLTLISRLAYDTHSSKDLNVGSLSLEKWRALTPSEVVKRYLTTSSPNNVVNDIKRLVMPYLLVLESRAERAGKPDANLVKLHLHEYILSAPAELLVSIFDASKPTLIASQRIITDDEDIARLALSCLYGSIRVDAWSQMSRIFECLPLWSTDGLGPEDEDEVEKTMSSLASFLAPSTSRPQGTPSELLAFFKPLHASSLSLALDILDVHLESGEILAKWGTPVTLQWLLQSTRNEAQQRAMATKLVRACNNKIASEDDWLSLLEDMLKLSRPEDSGRPSNSAFGTLSKEDIRRIFFAGLLSSGNFPVAKSMVQPRAGEALLSNDDVEKISLDCSRDIYDNASNGNYNFGDMKLAYDCLSVPHPTPAIEKEKEFIEATSRISSYNIMSRPGVSLLPIDIRLTKDKLTLISRVLSGNETAYKHVEVVLDLVRKLGYKGDTLAEVKTLAMITDTALQAEDFDVAYETSDRMVNTVLRFKSASSSLVSESADVSEAVEVCWVSCFQLGRHPEADNTERKMYLLGRALELCPPDKIADILSAWRSAEEEEIQHRQEILNDRKSPDNGARKRRETRGRAATLASKLQNLHINSPSLPSAPDAAAIASNALNRVAASLPFSIPGRERSGSREGSHRRAGSPDVQAQARHALQRGIGWLIGADESEL